MDGRYFLGAIAVVASGAAVSALRNSDTAVAWSVPFAVILLFLAFTGDSPASESLHWTSDPPLGGAGQK